jgi:hypothetical protein
MADKHIGFPPQGPLGRVPLSQQYCGMLRLPAAPPAALRLAVPRLRCCFVSPLRPERQPTGLGLYLWLVKPLIKNAR